MAHLLFFVISMFYSVFSSTIFGSRDLQRHILDDMNSFSVDDMEIITTIDILCSSYSNAALHCAFLTPQANACRYTFQTFAYLGSKYADIFCSHGLIYIQQNLGEVNDCKSITNLPNASCGLIPADNYQWIILIIRQDTLVRMFVLIPQDWVYVYHSRRCTSQFVRQTMKKILTSIVESSAYNRQVIDQMLILAYTRWVETISIMFSKKFYLRRTLLEFLNPVFIDANLTISENFQHYQYKKHDFVDRLKTWVWKTYLHDWHRFKKSYLNNK